MSVVENAIVLFQSLMQSDAWMLKSLAAWSSTLFLGESGALPVFLLSFQGFMHPASAAFFVFLGSMTADLFWYFMTVSAIRPWYLKFLAKKLSAEESRPFIISAEKYPYLMLVLIKFFVGIRLFLTIHIVTKKNISFHTYFVCNLLANILFVAVLFFLTWILNAGTESFFSKKVYGTYRFIVLTGSVLIAGHFLLHGIRRLFSKYLITNIPLK
jgi:hypothetical protein